LSDPHASGAPYRTSQARMFAVGLRRPVGWQPSSFLTDRAEAERAFQLAEHLGSVNAAATELGTTWPSLRKAFQRHGLGMPTRNPEAVRQRAITAARPRSGPPPPPPPPPGKPSATAPSPPPASAAASRPPQPWIRCLWRSTRAPFPPG